MGKPMLNKMKPIKLTGDELVLTVPQTAIHKNLNFNNRRKVLFEETPIYDASEPVVLSNQECQDLWYTKGEFHEISLSNKKDVLSKMTSSCSCSSSTSKTTAGETDSETQRGLESLTFYAPGRTKLRREHTANVLGIARMCRRRGTSGATMLAQFARQSSGQTGSTRAAYLRGLLDQEEAQKISAALA